jgi:mannose-6-phosphate isomerase-like protein (cupin superfamily)
MEKFDTMYLPIDRDTVAPDGSDVRNLLTLSGGGMAQFTLAPGETSIPVAHKTVEEIWYFVEGQGEMWRKLNDQEEVVRVEQGVCLTIPVGTHFQFRSFEGEALSAIGVTMPSWPGKEESYDVAGNTEWKTTLNRES